MASTTQPDPDWSRQHRARAGTDFIDAIWLDAHELSARLEQCRNGSVSQHTNGEMRALEWLLGQSERTPSTPKPLTRPGWCI